MKIAPVKPSEIPAGSKCLDVDGIPVVKLPSGDCIAFDFDGEPRPYPNRRKADLDGDDLSAADFRAWLASGRNRFDVSFKSDRPN